MMNNIIFLLIYGASFMPFLLLAFLNNRVNLHREIRCRQFFMPLTAVGYCLLLGLFARKFSSFCLKLTLAAASLFEQIGLPEAGAGIQKLCVNKTTAVLLVTFNTLAFLLYILVKKSAVSAFKKREVDQDSLVGEAVGLFYEFDEGDSCWYIRKHLGQARTFLKTVYYGGSVISAGILFASCLLYQDNMILTPYYPVFAVIIIGELAFFTDGLRKDEQKKDMVVHADEAQKIAMYPLLRTPLRTLFGDKLSSEGTTVNYGTVNGGAVEDVLSDIEAGGDHIGKNYAAFIRRKMMDGLKPNIDYVRSGYDLASGKSLLFSTPFYDKLVPYASYAMNRSLLSGGKALIVLGRHGTEQDLMDWCRRGMLEVTNVPNLWQIRTLDDVPCQSDDLPDIGIITRSGVHDLNIHRANLPFLKKVDIIVIVEPSRLVATAQIGLNLLVKCCGQDRKITFCSVDQNCDGLVDSLSHILMTSITEVSATEYPHGTNSFMCWKADGDYVQHRIVPGVSRSLGMGTELSFAALKHQVEKTVWYGGDKYPVQDVHWIAKQYYYDLLDYAKLPTNQETFDRCFRTSFNMCNEHVSSVAYVTVEDERNNVFEMKRNFATIAEQQGFVNVISSEYMLREYMADNTQLFNADPKAIPYITADYARTRRNSVLTLCLKLCVEGVTEKELRRQLMLIGVDSMDPMADLWREMCALFCRTDKNAKSGIPVITVAARDGKTELSFTRDDTLRFVRRYSVESGRFESIYSIEDPQFAGVILDGLQNAGYIAERDGEDCYIGTELKGHIYQKYLPGQFFTLSGKYYEIVSVTAGNRIIVRRASDHISGRRAYRQVRRYVLDRVSDSNAMGALKTINNIDVYYQIADFSVDTPAYWELSSYNDFDSGSLVELNGIPCRRYFNKQILKLDFSRMGDAFTDSVRYTLTTLLNETFVTLFADNQPFISAVTPGQCRIPMTYSLEIGAEDVEADKCIYILEDSQLDIGLLIAVERNLSRIFQIISDYLSWNDEKIEESMTEPEPKRGEKKTLEGCLKEKEEKQDKREPDKSAEEPAETPAEETVKPGKKNGGWFSSLFRRKKKDAGKETVPEEEPEVEEKPDPDGSAEESDGQGAAEKAEEPAPAEPEPASEEGETKEKAEVSADG